MVYNRVEAVTDVLNGASPHLGGQANHIYVFGYGSIDSPIFGVGRDCFGVGLGIAFLVTGWCHSSSSPGISRIGGWWGVYAEPCRPVYIPSTVIDAGGDWVVDIQCFALWW